MFWGHPETMRLRRKYYYIVHFEFEEEYNLDFFLCFPFLQQKEICR